MKAVPHLHPLSYPTRKGGDAERHPLLVRRYSASRVLNQAYFNFAFKFMRLQRALPSHCHAFPQGSDGNACLSACPSGKIKSSHHRTSGSESSGNTPGEKTSQKRGLMACMEPVLNVTLLAESSTVTCSTTEEPEGLLALAEAPEHEARGFRSPIRSPHCGIVLLHHKGADSAHCANSTRKHENATRHHLPSINSGFFFFFFL